MSQVWEYLSAIGRGALGSLAATDSAAAAAAQPARVERHWTAEFTAPDNLARLANIHGLTIEETNTLAARFVRQYEADGEFGVEVERREVLDHAERQFGRFASQNSGRAPKPPAMPENVFRAEARVGPVAGLETDAQIAARVDAPWLAQPTTKLNALSADDYRAMNLWKPESINTDRNRFRDRNRIPLRQTIGSKRNYDRCDASGSLYYEREEQRVRGFARDAMADAALSVWPSGRV